MHWQNRQGSRVPSYGLGQLAKPASLGELWMVQLLYMEDWTTNFQFQPVAAFFTLELLKACLQTGMPSFPAAAAKAMLSLALCATCLAIPVLCALVDCWSDNTSSSW